MPGPNRNREIAEVRAAGFPGRRIGSRSGFWPDLRSAMAALLFCAGVMLIPALAALDLSVGLACQNLGQAACIALFQPRME